MRSIYVRRFSPQKYKLDRVVEVCVAEDSAKDLLLGVSWYQYASDSLRCVRCLKTGVSLFENVDKAAAYVDRRVKICVKKVCV
jgi:hypothetical protein